MVTSRSNFPLPCTMLRHLLAAPALARIGTRSFAVGTVKWFNNTKGFGFLQGDDGVDVFVHQSNIKSNTFRMLEEGERVRAEQGGCMAPSSIWHV
jgi:cold shock CspA family protein